MPSIQIENLPDDLYVRIQSLALEHQVTLNEAVILLLQQAFYPSQTPELKRSRQAESASTVLRRIRDRHKVNPVAAGLPDSTALIREDRDR